MKSQELAPFIQCMLMLVCMLTLFGTALLVWLTPGQLPFLRYASLFFPLAVLPIFIFKLVIWLKVRKSLK